MLYFLQQFTRSKAALQLEVAVSTTFRAYFSRNGLYRTKLLYIMQQ